MVVKRTEFRVLNVIKYYILPNKKLFVVRKLFIQLVILFLHQKKPVDWFYFLKVPIKNETRLFMHLMAGRLPTHDPICCPNKAIPI